MPLSEYLEKCALNIIVENISSNPIATFNISLLLALICHFIVVVFTLQANRPQLERVYRGQMRVLTDEPFVPDPGSIFHMQVFVFAK